MERGKFLKCLAENETSAQGKCYWTGAIKGCNYYMVEGKAKEICYVK